MGGKGVKNLRKGKFLSLKFLQAKLPIITELESPVALKCKVNILSPIFRGALMCDQICLLLMCLTRKTMHNIIYQANMTLYVL